MKKIFTILAGLIPAISVSAQLAWDTEMTKSDFENAQTVISMTDNVDFSNPILGMGGGLSVGKIALTAYEDECVIALPQVGIADKLSFAWQGGSNGKLTIYQSADHNNWSQIFTATGNTISTDKSEEMSLSTTTRYLKFAASAHTAVAFRKIKVTELKSLSASTDEWPFGSGMVDDADAIKTVTISWTNIVAEVSSTDPHFSASLTSIGQKNQVDQTTALTLRYAHNDAGKHSGEIVIAGEGKEVRIAVTGETSKYDQTLTWAQNLSECLATDQVTLNAFSSSGLDIVYETSDNAVAHVDNSIVRITRAGSVTLTATQPGNYKYNAAESISKTLTIKKADPVIGVTVDEIHYGQPISEATIHELIGQVEGTLSWVDIKPDSLFDAGDYTLQVLFTPANTGIYNTRTMNVALHVNKAAQTITWENQQTSLTVGEPVPATAVLSSGLPLTYAFTECLLSIEEGVITPENEGSVTVIAYNAGNKNYLPTTVEMKDFVIQASQQIPTRTEQLTPEEQRAATKFLHAGKVFLYYNGQTYDAAGKKY